MGFAIFQTDGRELPLFKAALPGAGILPQSIQDGASVVSSDGHEPAGSHREDGVSPLDPTATYRSSVTFPLQMHDSLAEGLDWMK